MTQKLTREQAAIIAAYTGILCGPVGDLCAYAQRKLGVALMNHQFADPELMARLRTAAKEDFLALSADDDVREAV